MRILFAFAGGQGHFDPLAPLARAAAAAGHEVAFAGRADMLDAIEDAGFVGIASPGGSPDPAQRGPLVTYDRAAEERVLRDWYAGRLARRRAEALIEIGRDWRAERIVHDEVDFGAAVAAEALRIPSGRVLVIAAAEFIRDEVVAEPLAELRAAHELGGPAHRELVLSPFPASVRDEPGAFAFRAGDPPLAAGEAVYLTLGTVFNAESGDLLPRALEGVKTLGVPIVVTTGRQLDPAELGPQPGVRIQRWIPHEELLPWCRAIVSHGGSGSVLGALAHGLPSVLLPVGADQPLTAALVQNLGAGIALDALTATPTDIAAAVREVTTDPAYKAAATRLHKEIRSHPGSDLAIKQMLDCKI